jgi:hypothetical protein
MRSSDTSGRPPWLYSLQLLIDVVAGNFQIVLRLHSHPECGRRPKVPGKAQRRVGGDSSFLPREAFDAGARNADRLRDGVRREISWEQGILHERLRRDELQEAFSTSPLFSMIIHDLDVLGVTGLSCSIGNFKISRAS